MSHSKSTLICMKIDNPQMLRRDRGSCFVAYLVNILCTCPKPTEATVSIVKLPLNHVISAMFEGIHLDPSLVYNQIHSYIEYEILNFSWPPISDTEPIISIGPKVPSDLIAMSVNQRYIDFNINPNNDNMTLRSPDGCKYQQIRSL